MKEDERRELIIEHLAEMMRTTPFTFEFKVKKNPAGIKIIYEVTKEEMDNAMRQAQENR